MNILVVVTIFTEEIITFMAEVFDSRVFLATLMLSI